MPHIRVLFPKEYLAHDDLVRKNGPVDVTMTIAKVAPEDLRTDKGSERKWCVHFEEMIARNRQDKSRPAKRLVLNVTMAKSIAKLYGPETDNWIGERITLHATECMAFGDRVGCIRVREQVPKKKRGKEPEPAPDPEPENDIDELDEIESVLGLGAGAA